MNSSHPEMNTYYLSRQKAWYDWLLPDNVQLLNVGREEAIKLVIKDDNAKDKDKDKDKDRDREKDKDKDTDKERKKDNDFQK